MNRTVIEERSGEKYARNGVYDGSPEFTIEDTEALKPGMEVGVTEGVLPTSYYYTIEHALGMSANFKQAERLKTRRGIVKELKETPQFHIAVLEFDE